MKYFNSMPLVAVTKGNNTQVYRNIMARLSFIPSVLENPLVYYSYDVKEGDTPEIVAEKYYGDSYRYWIVLFSNQMMDPQWDWPLNSVALENYISDKYDSPNDVKSYQKVITQQNLLSGITTTNTVEITQDDYNNLVPHSSQLTLPNETVSVSIDKRILTYYQYEQELNESKRNIKLLNKNYVQQIEAEFQSLLS